MNRNKFENKVVFIIGATGGIGEVVTQRLAEEKANLNLIFQK